MIAHNQPVFWFGVVEDVKDPLKSGLVRVRVIGHHTSDLIKLPTNKLPWASVGISNSGSVSGIGTTATGLKQGSLVFGCFVDGVDSQSPFVICSVSSIPKDLANTSIGFNDPDGIFPKFNEEPDVNRLARNEKINKTIVQQKKDDLDVDVPLANGGVWNEIETSYAAVYPLNYVFETQSGHVLEYDDTEGSERIHQYHKSGTFNEIHPNGDKVEKIIKDNYEIIHGSNFVHIKGNTNVTVDGNSKVYIIGNADLQVDGNVNQTIGGNVNQTVSGSAKQTISGQIDMESDADINITASGVLNLKGSVLNLN